MKQRTIKVHGIEVQVPLVPNRILTEPGAGERSLPVRFFSERDLREIGRAWTEDLIERARQQIEEAAKR